MLSHQGEGLSAQQQEKLQAQGGSGTARSPVDTLNDHINKLRVDTNSNLTVHTQRFAAFMKTLQFSQNNERNANTKIRMPTSVRERSLCDELAQRLEALLKHNEALTHRITLLENVIKKSKRAAAGGDVSGGSSSPSTSPVPKANGSGRVAQVQQAQQQPPQSPRRHGGGKAEPSSGSVIEQIMAAESHIDGVLSDLMSSGSGNIGVAKTGRGIVKEGEEGAPVKGPGEVKQRQRYGGDGDAGDREDEEDDDDEGDMRIIT